MVPKWFCFIVVAISSSHAQQPSPVVTTKSGPIQGKLVRIPGPSAPPIEVYAFSGIPFAEPPVGELRYRKPTPVKHWGDNNTVLDATISPNRCLQTNMGGMEDFGVSGKVEGSEDCLYLNIWVPKHALDALLANNSRQNAPLSTYIFIHGGAFMGGSIDIYNSTILSGYNDMIVAAIQYRLGSLGFAYYGTSDVPGNMGLWDQLEAIKWISENIDFFGGNNGQITIGGESAGAASVACHLLSPHSRQYFQRAIIESGAAIAPWAVHTPQQAFRVTDLMLEQVAMQSCNILNTSAISEKTKCLKDAQGFVFPLADMAPARSGFGIPFTPVIDGDFIPRDPNEMLQSGDFSKVPLLVGANKDEGSMFLTMVPQIAAILPTPANPNVPLNENLTVVHYQMMTEGMFQQFLAGVQPATELLLDVIKVQYWPRTSDGSQPRGAQIVDAVSNLVADDALLCPTYATGKEAARFSKIFAYYFTHRRAGETLPEWMGITHAAELSFVFGEPFILPKQAGINEDISVSLAMMTYWANFVKYGDPNGVDSGAAAKQGIRLKYWPSLIGDNICPDRTFEINFNKLFLSDTAVVCGLKARDCQFWQSFFPKLMAAQQTSPKQTATF